MLPIKYKIDGADHDKSELSHHSLTRRPTCKDKLKMVKIKAPVPHPKLILASKTYIHRKLIVKQFFNIAYTDYND